MGSKQRGFQIQVDSLLDWIATLSNKELKRVIGAREKGDPKALGEEETHRPIEVWSNNCNNQKLGHFSSPCLLYESLKP